MGMMSSAYYAAALAMPLDARSLYLRRLVVSAMVAGGRGHLGSAMSLIEILRVLYDEVLRVRPEEPNWPERDRCVLSKGHGCLALYAVLAEHGFFPMETLKTFCRHDSILGGHPEFGIVPGVEASTGSLGHGLSIGVGLALAARLKERQTRTIVVLGDGELNEGSVWEAALSAGKHRLNHLTAVIDYNHFQSYGPTAEVQDLEPLADKWRSFGFAVAELNGHDVPALRDVFGTLPLAPDRPSAVICHTVKGKGVPFAENSADWHHKSRLNEAELAGVREALGQF
jgi:transketolase